MVRTLGALRTRRARRDNRTIRQDAEDHAGRRTGDQEWAREVLGDLNPLLGGVDSIVFLAGTAYREFLEPDLRSRGVAIQVPMAGMRHRRAAFLVGPAILVRDRLRPSTRPYRGHRSLLFSTLPNQGTCRRLPGPQDLRRTNGVAAARRLLFLRVWGGAKPLRSRRSGSAGRHACFEARIWNLAVEPALPAPGRHPLWKRGNHRSSIFRRIIGIDRAALARRGNAPLPASWGIGGGTGGAARRLHIDRATVKCEEADLEQCVSEYIGSMPFLWLEIDDPPGPTSRRGFVERNAIALLSHALEPAVDVP